MNQTDCIRIYREYCEANGWAFNKHAPVPQALFAIATRAAEEERAECVDACKVAYEYLWQKSHKQNSSSETEDYQAKATGALVCAHLLCSRGKI